MSFFSTSLRRFSQASSRLRWLAGLSAATGLFLASTAAAELPTASGVYLADGDDYQPLAVVSNVQGLNYDFAPFVLDLPEAPDIGMPLELVIIDKEIEPRWMQIEYRTIESPAAGERLTPGQKEKLDEHSHRFTVETDNELPGFLVVDIGCCQDNVYGIALTDVKAAITDTFTEEDRNPTSALHTVKGFLRGAPEDRELKKLVATLEERERHAEASRYFERIESAWNDYESAEEPAEKVEALEYVRDMAEHYLEAYPSAPQAGQAERYREKAAGKLDL